VLQPLFADDVHHHGHAIVGVGAGENSDIGVAEVAILLEAG
jgi:ATP-dependent Clp protease adapter protein ClpS